MMISIVLLAATAVIAAVPGTMSYQGRLLDDGGNPVNGTVTIVFSIYDDSLGGASGSPLWSETHSGVEVEDGLFAAVLGSIEDVIPDDVFTVQAWLSISINGETIEPITKLTSSPYSFSASTVKGDFESDPGTITLEDAAKGGGYLQLSSHTTGSSIAMVTNDLADVGDFAICASTQEDPIVKLQASQNLGGSLRIRVPSNDQDVAVLSGYGETGGELKLYGPNNPNPPIGPGSIYMGVDPSPFNTGILRMSDQEDGRTLLEVAGDPSLGARLQIYEVDPGPVGNLLAQLSRDALTFYQGSCFGKGSMRTYFSECGSAFDTTGETLKVDLELDREDYVAWYMYDGMKAGAMYVDETSVGIGVDSPSENLVVGRDLGSFSGNRIVVGDNTAGVTTGIVFGTSFNRRAWMLWDIDDQYVEFGTKDAWTTNGNTLVLRSGDVGIGRSDPSYKLDVDGDIRCTDLHQTSDGRLKSNVTQLAHALEVLQRINGVSFEWNALSESHGGTPGKQDIGVVADNVEDVLPELVYTDNEGYKSVAYSKLVPVLIEAVKELDTKTERIEQLESQVDELTALVNKLLDAQR